ITSTNSTNKKHIHFIYPYILYGIIILISLILFNLRGGKLIVEDFIELIRPVFWISGVIVGLSIVTRYGSRGLKMIFSSFIFIGIINSVFGWLMYLFPETFIFLFQSYNTPNLYTSGRPGGLAYTHTEFS